MLKHTNDMMRAIGLNVPTDDEGDSGLIFANLEEQPYADFDERPIMDRCGWDIDTTPVDRFFDAPVGLRLAYGSGMVREGWND